MATIYGDEHIALKEILARAGKNQDATLLIPDLQRPYVWQPSQVIVLVDSLVRGWPFGTLLTWKVRPDDPARELARSFWRVVDRASEEVGQPISMKHPPATFQMVLDGQQRVQSLLLAMGGDGWGFKLLDRQWHEHNGMKSSGPRGKAHWSLGCLCVNVESLNREYAKTRKAASIDYTSVLEWVVTDEANGMSGLKKPPTYINPLPIASRTFGRYVRLSRLWEAAPEGSIDSYAAEDIADHVLAAHGVSDETRRGQVRALGALIIALRDVKATRVTYLELAEYAEAYGSRDVYNDAIVNIFTRLNTAGRTLTREDITFAWLKIGWSTAATEGKSAKACIDELKQTLTDLELPLDAEDIISAISLLWSTSFNQGSLLSNNDLMRGEAIRPMAAHISENWKLVTAAAVRISTIAKDRGLRFREHYQSVNAIAYLWAWYFMALHWQSRQHLTLLDQDELEKRLAESLDRFMDRWLIGSQWAGVWSSSSAINLSRYAAGLSKCSQAMGPVVKDAVATLSNQIETDLKESEPSVIGFISTVNAEDRRQVREYYTALWLWNRLDKTRWKSAKLALRQKKKSKSSIEVDHIVSYDLWNEKLGEIKHFDVDPETGISPFESAAPKINDLGNCMLLEKNFNISKSNLPLKAFLDNIHEFKEKKIGLADWASALDIDNAQVDCSATPINTLLELFRVRSQKIRSDLEKFFKGTTLRVDLEPD